MSDDHVCGRVGSEQIGSSALPAASATLVDDEPHDADHDRDCDDPPRDIDASRSCEHRIIVSRARSGRQAPIVSSEWVSSPVKAAGEPCEDGAA
jgi:hypothetical protein